LTVNDQGNQAQVFVSNVLKGTVTRIDLMIPAGGNPVVTGKTQIASGYLIRTDPAALVVGPTGLAYDAANDILYVASTGDNRIFAVAHAQARATDAGEGTVVYKDRKHLHGPLALALTPNGDLITANGDAVNPDPAQPSELVEFTPTGKFVAELSVDSSPGSAFGLAVESTDDQIHFAAVDDALNTLDIWTINPADGGSRTHPLVLQTGRGPQTSGSSLDATAVDQLFAGSPSADQQMWFTSPKSSARNGAVSSELDG
jgi:hypothetical protein